MYLEGACVESLTTKFFPRRDDIMQELRMERQSCGEDEEGEGEGECCRGKDWLGRVNDK